MWEIEYSTQFKKDLKRFKHQYTKIEALRSVLTQLSTKGTVDGCMECHVQNDFLLVWTDIETKTIKLIRLGSHAELFK